MKSLAADIGRVRKPNTHATITVAVVDVIVDVDVVAVAVVVAVTDVVQLLIVSC